jgi:hypothetical protein
MMKKYLLSDRFSDDSELFWKVNRCVKGTIIRGFRTLFGETK